MSPLRSQNDHNNGAAEVKPPRNDMKSSSWRDLRLRLREQEGRDFEREVERLLRFRFPDLIQSPARQRLDQAGIDLISRNEDGSIEVAIQCKGYEVSLPGTNQIRLARDSILSFANSSETAQRFIFIHNRDGRASELRTEVQALLQELVASGKCPTVEYYDLDAFLNHCKQGIRLHLAAALRKAAARKLGELREIFEVGGPPQKVVPATEAKLILDTEEPSANLSGMFDVRLTAARRYWLALNGRNPGGDPAALSPTQRDHLIDTLRALDARLESATYREIAAALFHASRLPERGWKTHDLRDRTIRLCRLGIQLMQGGYRQLLLHPYRHRLF
jgi:hypothetical protein